MAKQDNIIRLLLVEDSAEDAEQVVSQLRNAGVAVRPQRAETRDAITAALAQQEIDLVLASARSKIATPAEVVVLVERAGKDRPVVALVPAINDEAVLQAQREKVRALALRGNPEHLVATVRREAEDLGHRRALRRLDAALKESERRCEALLDSSRDPIAFVHEGMHVRANRAYLEMFGFGDREELEGVSILDMIAPDAAESFKALLKKLSKGEKPPAQLQIHAQKSDGTAFDAVMEFASATFEGEPCQQITFRQQQSAAAPPPDTDLVTGLHNRQYLLRELDSAVSEAAAGRNDIALLYVEPDNWRTLIEMVGLGNADLVISDMAERLRALAGDADVAARFSDNALMLLVRRRSHEDAARMAHTLRRAFEGHIFEAAGRSVPLPVSVGAVLVGEKIANAEAILSAAARALKQAQDAGGNRVALHDPAAQDKADHAAEKQRLAEIRDALEKDGFVLFFQPIISLHGAEGEYYEILLRMRSPRGELLPAEFFPTAEKNGLLPAIDRWVVATAVKTLAERERAGHRTVFFVKITVPTLEDPSLLPWIAAQLKAHRVSGDRLVFEMPESKVTTNLRPVREFQKGLAQLHVGFAVQQFGSGINSFQMLKHVDCNYLKIDRTFMAELSRNRENQQRIKEICDQAHGHGKLTIAEFVEDAASMSILFGYGVNFVQGNFLQEAEKVMAYDFGQ
jgi:diguanylate cyclase (GGDEF)-like protein/PAS domain S-box-containing protein